MKLIRIGMVVVLAVFLAASVLVVPSRLPVRAATCTVNHTVASGETISSIAEKYKVTYQAIATANDLKEPYTITVGQVLCIPGATTATTTTAATTSNKPTYETTYDGKFLTVTISNLPKKSIFYIKVGSGLPRDADLQKIGMMHTRKNTSATKSYRLPKSFADVRVLTVCFKNAKTDANQCQYLTMPR